MFRPAISALLVALSLAVLPALSRAEEARRTISVSGTGEVSAAPDMAVVTLGVRGRAETAAGALKANSEAMNAVFDTLDKLGVAPRDVQTVSLSLSPVWKQVRTDSGMEQRQDGFQAANMVQVKLRDLDKVGPALDALVEAGANELNGVSFDIAEKDALLDEARKAAVLDAASKAKLYAEAAGVKLGEVISLSESGPGIMPPRPQMALMREASVPVAEGEQTISVNVSVVYAIE